MNTPLKKLHSDIEDIAEEFEAERTSHTNALQPEQLHQALEDMRAGKSPKHFSADPEFQAALRLHVYTSDTEMNEASKDALKNRLVQQFGVEQETAVREQRIPFWKHGWFAPSIFASAAGVAVLIVVISINGSFSGNGSSSHESLAVRDKNSNSASDDTPENTNQQPTNNNAFTLTAPPTLPENTSPDSNNTNTEKNTNDTPTNANIDSVEIASIENSVDEVQNFADELDAALATVEETNTTIAQVNTDTEEINNGIQLLSTSLNE